MMDTDRVPEVESSTEFSVMLTDLLAELQDRPALVGLGRVAVALYDGATGILKSFAHATDGEAPFEFYDRHLDDVPSLQHLVSAGKPRVIDDMEAETVGTFHSQRLVARGFRSSYAEALIDAHGALQGFLFFDASRPGFFTPERIRDLKPYVRLIHVLVSFALEQVRVLRAAVRTVRDIGDFRDDETGGHLERMARYARLVAQRLAPSLGKNEEWVENITQFAPLHDIGKVAVPDSILLKPGKLTPEEFEIMKGHVMAGVNIVKALVRNFHLQELPMIAAMTNVVACHHEAMDGSGYPLGLRGEHIPIEARIVSVADVFDALTSPRRYKAPWSNDAAFAYLREQSNRKFDPLCVQALVDARADIEHIQRSIGLEE
jgi:HD-GYP domain-containing protein (c-di-GMP phosphodiesterase class II)